MAILTNRSLRIYLASLLAAYILTSLYGVVWISDEFDQYRAWFMGYFALPTLAVYLLMLCYIKNWWLRHAPSFVTATAIVLLSFAWGNFLLLNNLSEAEPQRIKLAKAGPEFSHQRGGFGWIYRTRW